jgi:hypothetical protein
MLEFPFFNPFPGDDTSPLLGRNETLETLNKHSKGTQDKYTPFLLTASRGMGKTFFLKAVGSHRVPEEYKNQRIQDAIDTGRIISFELNRILLSITVQEIREFPTHLLIFYLCNLFKKSQVDGMYFDGISEVCRVKAFRGTQKKFRAWISYYRDSNASEMIDEYIRLTNLAFKTTTMAPPVFLLDNVRNFCYSRPLKNPGQDEEVKDAPLSMILRNLSQSKLQPICICAGSNHVDVMDSIPNMSPVILRLRTLLYKVEYTAVWKGMTRYLNDWHSKRSKEETFKVPEDSIAEKDLFEYLVFASCQVPRILRFAHETWYDREVAIGLGRTPMVDKKDCLRDFKERTFHYYREMNTIWRDFSDKDIAQILLICSVPFEVSDTGCVPGTEIPWSTLIQTSIVFPHLNNCFVFPFELIFSENTYYYMWNKQRAVKKICCGLIKNLDIEDLFTPYDELCNLDVYNLGIRFERLFVSSLAVKYYLHSTGGKIKFTEIYDFRGAEEAKSKLLMEPYMVDFSDGIFSPSTEAFVNSLSLPATSIIHNGSPQNTDCDIILPAFKGNERVNIPVSLKTSFELPEEEGIDDDERRVSKKPKNVETRIWLSFFVDSEEAKNIANNVAILNSSGCCNGLALDKFAMLKRAALKESEQ